MPVRYASLMRERGKYMRTCATLAILMTALLATMGGANVNLVQDGRSGYTVVIGKDASVSEHYAASELKQFIQQMSGAVLPYSPDGPAAPEKAILIGDSQALRSLGLEIDWKELGDEGFVIRTVGDRLVIAGSRLRGTLYGVYAFLESLGWRYYAKDAVTVPHLPDITLGALDVKDKPAFEYRDVFIREAMNPDWAARNRAVGANAGLDAKRGGAVNYYPFVHSFGAMLPLDKYWDTHPEYYSEINGKRTRDNTQLCMSNPEVVKIATQVTLQWMKEHPEAKICSVSQNDWYNNCQCAKCKAIDEEEGSPSGLMLRFVNAIAAETSKVYPDKLVDTLAYQWTEKPCKITKPHPNVRVRLCPIFCCEAHPYGSCDAKENVAFMENLKAWSQITDQLYIWHYNTSFAAYLNPFPDYRQLMDTARLYKKSGVKGIFWEGAYPPGGGTEMGYLRAYLLAKVSWNPDIDGYAVMRDFCNDFYGRAGKYILEYIRMLEDKVTKENIHVHIWANAVDAYLTPEIVAKADALFDQAEAAADSEIILDRVQLARLSIDYVKLMKPILNKQTKGKEAEHLKKLDDFIAKCKGYGIDSIREGQPLDAFYNDTKKAIGG